MAQPITHSYNLEVKAHIENFHGWEMPISYSGIVDEYLFTRESATLFDVSHMGRLLIDGKEASKYLDYLITNNVTKLKVQKALYCMLLNENGGIIDDLIIYKLEEEKYFVVCNAGNREQVIKHLKEHIINFEANLIDLSESVAQIAIQGPKAKEILEKYLNLDQSIPYFNCKEINFKEEKLLITATGYTGEKGYELYTKTDNLMKIWKDLLDLDEVKAAGLGARDLLRLEAGYCLHGNDINTETSPSEANLSWTVDYSKENFIGKEKSKRKNKILKGLIFPERKKLIARAGTQILNESGSIVGEITSGSYSQILDRAIALAYINDLDLENGQELLLLSGIKAFKQSFSDPWFYRNIKGKEISYEKIL